jgi:uncharacterized membrane protein
MRETMLVVHFLGLAMGVGTSFAFMTLGIAARKMAPDKRREFLLNAAALGRLGHIGLTLMILSGIYLIIPYWSVLGSMPLLIAKLILVLVLAAVVGIGASFARKAKQGDAVVHFPKMAMMGRLGLLTSITIVVLAVLVFR